MGPEGGHGESVCGLARRDDKILEVRRCVVAVAVHGWCAVDRCRALPRVL